MTGNRLQAIGFRRNGQPIYLIAGGAPTPLEIMQAEFDRLHLRAGQMIDKASAEKRGFLASEQREFDKIAADKAQIRVRLNELEEQEHRNQVAARARVEIGDVGPQPMGLMGAYTSGGETYHRGNQSPSFFRDLIHAQRGDLDAADRLRRNNQQTGLEQRALGNSGGVGGSGGEFSPPAWIVEDFIKLARPGRVTADLFHREDLPQGVSSVDLPKVATGTTTAVQTTQNTALSSTDPTTTGLASGITTIGGKNVVSQQLLDQSAIPFDRVVLEDLSADYARQLGTQVISGSGTSGQLRGFLTPSSTNVVTWTQATPTVAGFYGQLAKLQGQITTSRYAMPDTVVMSPRRWAWFASGVDGNGRPLVTPATGYNTMAQPGAPVAAGHVGSVLGMDCFVDPNIPVNLGAGTNQDIVLMFPREDIWFWESELRAEAFTAPYSDSLGVLFRVFGYSAMIPDRYLASLGQISGTGLVTPVFQS